VYYFIKYYYNIKVYVNVNVYYKSIIKSIMYSVSTGFIFTKFYTFIHLCSISNWCSAEPKGSISWYQEFRRNLGKYKLINNIFDLNYDSIID